MRGELDDPSKTVTTEKTSHPSVVWTPSTRFTRRALDPTSSTERDEASEKSRRLSCCRHRRRLLRARPREGGDNAASQTMRDLGLGSRRERADNTVVTAKYTLLTYLPKSFLEQFRHMTNVYFVFIFVIALIGNSSLKWFDSPLPAEGFMLALLVVVIVTMVFEGWYDVIRHREDSKVNNRIARRVLPGGAVEPVRWASLRPGDVVVVERGETFPADLLFLAARSSSVTMTTFGPGNEEDDEFDPNRCYVETSNVDGETNLKIRATPLNFLTGSQSPSDSNWLASLKGWDLQCEPPSAALDFSGQLSNAFTSRKIPLDFANLLLRGSSLRNTPEIVGLCVYCGYETKAVMSTKATRTKTSNVIILVNRIIVIVLLVGLTMVVVSAAIASTYIKTSNALWYLKNGVDAYIFGPFFWKLLYLRCFVCSYPTNRAHYCHHHDKFPSGATR